MPQPPSVGAGNLSSALKVGHEALKRVLREKSKAQWGTRNKIKLYHQRPTVQHHPCFHHVFPVSSSGREDTRGVVHEKKKSIHVPSCVLDLF